MRITKQIREQLKFIEEIYPGYSLEEVLSTLSYDFIAEEVEGQINFLRNKKKEKDELV